MLNQVEHDTVSFKYSRIGFRVQCLEFKPSLVVNNFVAFLRTILFIRN